METEEAPFRTAMRRYSRAKARLARSIGIDEPALAAVDDALDGLLAIPSPSHRAFGRKLQILRLEYGIYAQPRHLAALFADAAMLAWLMF